jgi:hypothetical protein
VGALLLRFGELHGRVSAVASWGSVSDNATLVLRPYIASAPAAEKAAAKRLLDVLEGYVQP